MPLTHERVPVARQLAEAYCTLDAEAVAADWASKERNLPPTYVTIIGWVLGLLPVRSRTTLRSSHLPIGVCRLLLAARRSRRRLQFMEC